MNVSLWCGVCATQEDITDVSPVQLEHINDMWARNHKHSPAARKAYYDHNMVEHPEEYES